MNISTKLNNIFTTYSKYKTLGILRQMSNEQLTDIGIAPELLLGGVAAWPWKDTASHTTGNQAQLTHAIKVRPVWFDVSTKEVASGALSSAA